MDRKHARSGRHRLQVAPTLMARVSVFPGWPFGSSMRPASIWLSVVNTVTFLIHLRG